MLKLKEARHNEEWVTYPNGKIILLDTIKTPYWDLEKNFSTFLRLLDEAKDADIFVTPECFLDGYAADLPEATTENMKERIAQDLNTSKYIKRVAQEAKKRNMYICFGFTSLENGKIYNSAGLWDNNGELVGVYHKTHLQYHDLKFEKGMEFPVWNTRWDKKVGIMICADRRWPETARTLRLNGARIILTPSYSSRHIMNEFWMRTRASENHCYIVFSHPEEAYIVSPSSLILGKRTDNPGVLICDIEISKIPKEEVRDRRPEIYFK